MNYLFQKSNYPIVKMGTCYHSDFSPFNADLLENKGTLKKEKISLNVEYKFDDNSILKKGAHFKIRHFGAFQCVSCKKNVKKLFDGFCFPCLKKKASADRCVMSPHLCHYMAGTCREPDWGDQFCYQPHYVYLAYTDKYKVGITRHTQIPTRWVDQGATSAALLAKVTSRNQAGILEHTLKGILHDKSHWLNMLKNGNQRPTQQEFFEKVLHTINWLKNLESFQSQSFIVETPTHLNLNKEIILFEEPVVVEIHYDLPREEFKFKSMQLDKTPEINGKITGIKGQYLFFGENVFNMRRHEGYLVDMELTE